MKLIEFYTAVLDSIRVSVDENGFLQITKGDEKVYLTKRKGLRVALPTKENLDKIYAAGPDGKFKQQYLIFHPLSEDSVGNGVGLDLLIEHAKTEMELSLIGLGTLLLNTYMNPKLQSDLPYEINEFIVNAKDKSIVGMKANGKAVDDTMVSTWQKLTLSYFKSVDKSLLTLVVPRTKKNINKDTNTREARLGSDLLFDLQEHIGTEEKVTINGISVRPKEVKIFIDILKLFLIEPNEKGTYIVGTKDLNIPGFIATMLLYTNIVSNVNRSALALEQADPTVAKDIRIPLLIDKDSILQAYETYKLEIVNIPTEGDINLGTSAVNGVNGVNTSLNNLHPAVATAINQQQVATFQPDVPKDGMQALLASRDAQMQQMMNMQNQMLSHPGGINGIALPQTVNNRLANVNMQPAQATGGMVSVLNPQYNSYATNQVLQSTMSQTQTTGFGNMSIGFNGMNMNTGMMGNGGMGMGYNNTAVGYNLMANRSMNTGFFR